ncbi:MAG TPA: glycosyltransferase family 4 protein [Bryobacteraceae bacterium]|nr:glycosyltransferase family 4 protein [Bryobacteraceae bacterium]
MRIVYLNPCGNFGGAETSLRELLAGVRAAEPSWRLWMVLGEDGPLAEAARALQVQVIVKPFPAALRRIGDTSEGPLRTLVSLARALPGTARYALSLAALLRDLQPDVLHTNGLKMHLLGAWARPRRTPLVWHIHDYVSARRFTSRLLRAFRRACTVAIANSKSVARDLEALLLRIPIRPIYNAVDLLRFSPSGSQLDLDSLAALPPAGPGIIRIGLVATFAKWKGQEVFLEAMARLRNRAAVRGYIIGGPIYQTAGSQWMKSELQRKVEDLGLRDMVGFTGFVDDVPAAMRSLDIVVHASTQPEPFGMVIVEAMASSKPVVASQSGGATELFIDGVNALGHRPGDTAMLAERIQLLVDDAGLRARLGQAGRESAERNFPARRLAQELGDLYREISSEAGSAHRTAAMMAGAEKA